MKDRLAEYQQIMTELETPVPGLEHTLERAKQRSRRRKWIERPFISMAAVFACFVLLVNFCMPVAYACSQIPGLRELAQAVSFSRSLSDAVENQYVQPVDIALTDGDVALTVEYLIVDQKQVNVFFRLKSEVYEAMSVIPYILDKNGEDLSGCIYGCNGAQVPVGELQSMTVEFLEADVPEELKVRFLIEDLGAWTKEAALPAEPEQEADNALEEFEPDIAAEFEFLLSFDSQYTATGRVVPLNQTVELDGQRLCFTSLEIYPTHLRINVEAPEENTAWLKKLDFYVRTDWGMKFEPVERGIVSTGAQDSPMMCSYRADSTYFYEAKHVSIVVTGAEWLDKDMERVHIHLAAGEAERMPEGTELLSAIRQGEDWIVEIKAPAKEKGMMYQVFSGVYYDAQGERHDFLSWQTGMLDGEEADGTAYFYERFRLRDYPYDEVWLSPVFSRRFTAQQEIEIEGW